MMVKYLTGMVTGEVIKKICDKRLMPLNIYKAVSLSYINHITKTKDQTGGYILKLTLTISGKIVHTKLGKYGYKLNDLEV